MEFPQNGTFGIFSNSAEFLKKKVIDFKTAVVYTIENAASIIENLLKLTFLYVGIFLIQVLLLPLLVFWILYKMANGLFPKENSQYEYLL